MLRIGELEEESCFNWQGNRYRAADFSRVPGYRKCFKIFDYDKKESPIPFVFLRCCNEIDKNQ